MSLVPYTITALERDVVDADASGKNIISGATCSMFIQPANTAALLYDDAAGSNGSTAKVTNASGQVVVFVENGTYIVNVNGVAGVRVDVDQLRADLASGSADIGKLNPVLLSTVVADSNLTVGMVRVISDRANGIFDVVLSSSVTVNTFNIVACTGVATLALVLRVGDVPNVKQFGAVGRGGADDGGAIQSAINYLASIFTQHISQTNGFNRVGGTVFFPSGIYNVAGTLLLERIGIVLLGAGQESTTINKSVEDSTALFRLGNNVFLYNVFENISMSSGEVKTSDNGKLFVDITSVGFRLNTCFDYTNTTSSNRFNTWNSVFVRGGFSVLLDIGGSATHSENTYNSCLFEKCDTGIRVDNEQSIIHKLNSTSIEFMDFAALHIKQGGTWEITGGSMISAGDFIRLEPPSEGGGVGSGNAEITMRGVKFEMYNNIDPSKNPKLVNCITTTYANITFDACNNLAGGALDTDVILILRGSVRCNLVRSSIIGVAECFPSTTQSVSNNRYNTLSALILKDCLAIPSFQQTTSNGFKYRLIRENCKGYADLKTNGGENAIGDTKSSTTAFDSGVINNSSRNFEILFDFVDAPEIYVEDVFIRSVQSGGSANTLNLYSDAARTTLVQSIALGTFVGASFLKVNILAKFPDGIFFTRTSASNIGLTTTYVSVDYYGS
jgi:hypothetical protein